MGLREMAEADLSFVLEDRVTGFGWDITVTDPAGNVGNLVGSSTDISQLIDPDTGQQVSGRLAVVTVRNSSLTAAGLGTPVSIADASIKPWLVAFDDINGNSYTFKVSESNPDRALGIITLILETYE